jgi:putative NIF3 family GTP cyclohydrolase 1 type 2
MFAIVPADDDMAVFSYGIDTGEEAFTFRRDPESGRTLFSVHENADRALRLANRIVGDLAELQLMRYPITEPLAEGEDDGRRERRDGAVSKVPTGFSIETEDDLED